MNQARIRSMSRYRQFKLQATQGVNGDFSYSIYAKGLNDGWNEHHLLVRDSKWLTDLEITSTEDVIRLLLVLLDEQLLPPLVE